MALKALLLLRRQKPLISDVTHDINHSLEQETSKASSATLLARSVGLDTSLYTTVMPLPYYASMERVNIKRPSQNLQELSYGQINFNATYSEHKKK
uniref:Uncharacterized protein n=1 Tax=Timema monikensis TaxID=170555 RepID=A0A7R9EF91_9NEOP|nr:unnamed protein product [Timema monikensis]